MQFLDSHVAYVLFDVAFHGRESRLGLAVRRADPLYAGIIQRRAEREIRRAHRETALVDESHALRLAFLRAHGTPVAAPDDAEDVSRRFAATVPPPRPKPWPSVVTVSALLFAVAVFALWYTHRPSPYDALEQRLPAVRDAFAHGGRPLPGSPETREVFATRLPAYIVALGRRKASETSDESEIAEARAALLSTSTRSSVDPRVYGALARLVAVGESWVGATRDFDAVLSAVVDVNEALATSGLGYYVDALGLVSAQGVPMLVVYSCAVERVVLYRAGGREERVLHLRRIDRLNVRQPLLGYTRTTSHEALVLLDAIEEHLVDTLLPALDADSPLRFAEDGPTGGNPALPDGIRERVRSVVNEELGGPPGRARDDLSVLGRTLSARAQTMDEWRARLIEREIVLRAPSTYRIDLDRYEPLRRYLLDFDRLEAVESSLAEPQSVESFLRAASTVIASVEKHEVQHRLDARREPTWQDRPELQIVLPWYASRSAELRAQSVQELSAYLASVVRDDRAPRTGLTLLAVHLFDRRRHGSRESAAAHAIFEGLSRELGHPIAVTDYRGRIDLARVGEAYLLVTAAPVAELHAAASRLYAELFGRAPEPMSVIR